MSERKHLIINGFCLPLDVESMESLPVAPGGVLQCDFVFQNIRFALRYEDGPEHGILRIVGDVGPMPFSAESPAARIGLNRVILRSREDWRPWLHQAKGRIVLGGDFEIHRPITAVKLITKAVEMLIPAIPYLDLIALYVRPPLAAAKRGESAVQPQWRKKALPAKALPAPARRDNATP